jgi:hypothetical protein
VVQVTGRFETRYLGGIGYSRLPHASQRLEDGTSSRANNKISMIESKL